MCAAVIEPHPALLGPFAILLLSIAIFPLILRQHWERHYQKLCALLAATTCGYYVFALHGAARVQHIAGEYATFIVVVGTFFVVAGAIHLHIPRPASPLSNVTFLCGGSILANFIGTIGASMLLLRPFLQMNRGRGSGMHVAFFIFIVGNLGGALLPVGPPLFLGYIKGVPFLWAALHCWPQWLTATGALLVIFFVADTIAHSRGPAAETPVTRFHCYGRWNFGALLALLLTLVFVPNGVREPLMLMVAMASYFFTPQRVFEANEFGWRPLIEVAWIFLGIFGTVIPVLDYVEFHASDFHLASDARFYWSTGLLSGVLDNAPTYLTFLTAALSIDHLDINHLPDVAEFASGHGSRLAAISLAATLFGGLTYIGNSPNIY
jgi:Na+/H+ antiporter NhaD/arsenite permease-like protein